MQLTSAPSTFVFALGSQRGMCCVLDVSQRMFDLLFRVHDASIGFNSPGEKDELMAELYNLKRREPHKVDHSQAVNLVAEYARRFSLQHYTFRRAVKSSSESGMWKVLPGGKMFNSKGASDTKHCGNNTLQSGKGGKHEMLGGMMAGTAFDYCPRVTPTLCSLMCLILTLTLTVDQGCAHCVEGDCKHPTRIWCNKCDLTCWCSMECKRENAQAHKPMCDAASKIRKQIGFDLVCHQCGIQESKACHELKRCGECKQALYCSKECSTKAWKAGHSLECKPRPMFESKAKSKAEKKAGKKAEQKKKFQECKAQRKQPMKDRN